MSNHYKAIFAYFKTNWKWCGLTLLIIVEVFVFACLNAEPNNHYEQYVAETSDVYNSLLGFIFWENLKSSLLLVLWGTIPFGLGSLYGIYSVNTSLVTAAKWLLPDIGARNMFLCCLPHGGFEILSICFSLILSVLWSKLVTTSIIRLFCRNPVLSPFREEGTTLLKSIILVQIPLVLIAAVMEATLSAWITEIVL